MKRYCLANYILTADIPDDIGFGTQTVSIGGEGSYLNSITVSRNAKLFELSADNTGSWVYNKNLNRSGSVAISIKQVSDKVATFKALINAYFSLDSDASGMTLTLRDTLNNTICVCEDCVLEGIPNQEFSTSAGDQSWTFLCGKITFVDTVNS